MSDEIFQIAYLSSATEQASPDRIREILWHSRSWNERYDVTGMLLFHDGNFMQFIEGDQDILAALLLKIERDPAHKGLITLFRGMVVERTFPNWSMAFYEPASLDIPGLGTVKSFEDLRCGHSVLERRDPRAAIFVRSFFKVFRDLPNIDAA